MRRTILPFLVAGLLLRVESGASGEDRPRPRAPSQERAAARPGPMAPRGMAPPPRMRPALYELLHRRMLRHGDAMTRLINLVVLLRYDEIVPVSERMVREPALGPPQPGEMDELNAQLPSTFYLYQDLLAERARALSEAARARNDLRLAAAFGGLTETCIACHAAYRNHTPSDAPRR